MGIWKMVLWNWPKCLDCCPVWTAATDLNKANIKIFLCPSDSQWQDNHFEHRKCPKSPLQAQVMIVWKNWPKCLVGRGSRVRLFWLGQIIIKLKSEEILATRVTDGSQMKKYKTGKFSKHYLIAGRLSLMGKRKQKTTLDLDFDWHIMALEL